MKKKIKLSKIVVVFILCFTACNSDDDYYSNENNQSSERLVDKVYNYNNDLIGEYFYNSNNQLIKRKDTDPINNKSSEYQFVYENNRIKEIIYIDHTFPGLNHNILVYYNGAGQIFKDETYKNGQQVGGRSYIYYQNRKLKGIVDQNGVVNPTFHYSENGNLDEVTLLTSPDATDEIIYNYEFDCSDTPNFGLGKIFQIEPLPYFGNEAVIPKNLSCHNMTLNSQSGTQWLYEYNDNNLPETIEAQWLGVETVDPIMWRIHYTEIEQ